MEKLEAQLKRPVNIRELAMRYGLDYDRLQKIVDTQEEAGEDKKTTREARRNLGVLKSIQRYLQTARSTMTITGNKVHFALQRLPCSLLTIEEQRCESLSQTGHRLAHIYTKEAGQAH